MLLSRSLRLRSVSRTPVQNVSISVSSLEVCEAAALMANFPNDMANSPKDSSCSWVLYLSANLGGIFSSPLKAFSNSGLNVAGEIMAS